MELIPNIKYPIVARSISLPAYELLQRPFTARVLAVFEHACDLTTPGGDVIALVTLQISDGPLNIVVDAEPGDFAVVESEAQARTDGNHLRISGLDITLAGAVVWEPHPDWNKLCDQRDTLSSRLPLLSTVAQRDAPAGSLLSTRQDALLPHIFPTVTRAVESLRAGWEGNLAKLQDAVTQLAGLGSGLTPAGDDFLTGAMLWAWLAHPSPLAFCCAVAEAAAPRTTTLSAAFLRAAARGECSAAWHQLLAALGTGTESELATAICQVLAHGATSGADTLAGFIWMASRAVT
jgi:hypothetical protein